MMGATAEAVQSSDKMRKEYEEAWRTRPPPRSGPAPPAPLSKLDNAYQGNKKLLQRMDEYIDQRALEWAMMARCLSLDHFLELQREREQEFVSPFASYVSRLREVSDQLSGNVMASLARSSPGVASAAAPVLGGGSGGPLAALRGGVEDSRGGGALSSSAAFAAAGGPKRYQNAQQALREERSFFAKTDGFKRLREEALEKHRRQRGQKSLPRASHGPIRRHSPSGAKAAKEDEPYGILAELGSALPPALRGALGSPGPEGLQPARTGTGPSSRGVGSKGRAKLQSPAGLGASTSLPALTLAGP